MFRKISKILIWRQKFMFIIEIIWNFPAKLKILLKFYFIFSHHFLFCDIVENGWSIEVPHEALVHRNCQRLVDLLILFKMQWSIDVVQDALVYQCCAKNADNNNKVIITMTMTTKSTITQQQCNNTAKTQQHSKNATTQQKHNNATTQQHSIKHKNNNDND